MRTQEPLYILEDLFRVGNVEGPRLDPVRERDVAMVYRHGKTFVLPNTGVISAFNQIHPELKGIWWRCLAGTAYPEELQIICDRERGGLRHSGESHPGLCRTINSHTHLRSGHLV